MNKRSLQFTPKQFDEIKDLYRAGFYQYEIAEMFGCNQSHISRILSGKACSFQCLINKTIKTFRANVVASEYEPAQAKTLRAKRSRLLCTKLTLGEVKRIRRLYFSGRVTQMELSARFGVNQSTISQIVRGIIWKE